MEWLFNTCKYFWDKYLHKFFTSQKTLAGAAVFILTASTLPLIIIGFYNHPSADDFNYTILTGNALKSHSGISAFFAVIMAAIERATSYWGIWQGTYSMSFIAALRPSLLSENLTFLHSVILIGILIIGIFYLLKIILKDFLKFNTGTYITISCITAFLSIQYLPNAVEGFFWYTGGVGYTFFIYLAFILLGKTISAFYKKEMSNRNFIAFCCLSFIVAGGHFAITLFGFVFTFFFFIDALLNKSLAKGFKIKYTVNSIIYFAGFLLCTLAPGNFRRQDSFERQTAISAILKSYLHGLGYAKLYTNTVVFLGILLVGIVAFFNMKKVKYKFKYPVIFTLITFSMYAVILMPGYFSTNGIPAPRYLDIIYFVVIIFFVVNIIYYAGWLYQKLELLESKLSADFAASFKPVASKLIIFAFVMYAIVNLTTLEVTLSTGVRAIKSLASGEAKEFDRQMDEREKLYHDASVKEVYIDALTVYPELIYFSDITPNKDDYANYKIAEYYDKDFVVIK